MKLGVALLCISLLVGCGHKKAASVDKDQDTYDQPAGPTTGLVRILDHSSGQEGEEWVWYEFIATHQVKEYGLCKDSDKSIVHMVGNISLAWDKDRGCFMVASFYRDENLETK